MYNPRYYAISIEKLLGTPQSLTGEIENNPLTFLSVYLDEIYNTDEAKTQLIDNFDEKFSKYQNKPLLNWNEEDSKELINDLKKIFQDN